MNREILRKIIATVVAFGVSVALTVAFIALCGGVVLSRPYFSLLTGDSYKQKVTAEVLSELESYAIPGGLPRTFFETELDKKLLAKDVDRSVDAAFDNKTIKFETFTAATRDSILNFAEENNISAIAGDEEVEDSIDELVKLCSSAYKRLVNSEIIKFGGAISRQLGSACLIAALASAAVAAVLLFATGKLGGKNFLRIALGGAGMMLFLLPCYLLIFRNISKLGITSPSMYSLATGIIYSLLGFMIAAAVILLILANIPYKRKKSEV